MIRIVVDTNTAISAFLWGGTPRHLFSNALELGIVLLSSEDLLHELQDKLSNKPVLQSKLVSIGKTAAEVIEDFLSLVELVTPSSTIPNDAISDQDDMMVLAAAMGGDATFIVSGDKHLLKLGNYEGIQILKVSDFLNVIRDLPQ